MRNLFLIFLAACTTGATESLQVNNFVDELQDTVEVRSVLKLKDGTFINNWPSGRSAPDFEILGFDLDPVTSDLIYIDDSEIRKITYYGNWRISDTLAVATQDGGNCFCSWSQSPGDSVVIKFTNATGFAWVGERMPFHGIAELWFNDRLVGEVDTYKEVPERLTVNYAIDNLDPELIYKFKMIATGKKNPASNGTYVVNQMFTLETLIEDPIPDPDPDPDPDPIPGEIDTVFITRIDTVLIKQIDTVFLEPKIIIRADEIDYLIK